MTGGTAQVSNHRISIVIAGGVAALVTACLLFAPVAGGSSAADDTFTEVSGSPNPSAPGQVVAILGRECNRSRTVQATGVIAFTDLTTGKSLGSNKLGSVQSPYSNCGDTTIEVPLSAGDHTIQAQYDPSGQVPVTPSKPATYTQIVAVAPDPKLSVEKAGSGNGTVTSKPAGIDCGRVCSATFPQQDRVALIASADPDSTFKGWSEPSCDTTICYVTLDRDKSVTATFVAVNSTLSVSKTGSGTVTSAPAGIACGNTCSAQFKTGTTVGLSPVADQGWKFVSWGGACSGSGPCNVTLDGDKSVTATFALVGVPPVRGTLTVTRQGSGSGSVTSDPGGINCGSACSASYAPGTKVSLTAAASDNSTFTGWSGACSGTGACSVTVNGDVSVTASFAAKDPAQTVPTQPPPPDQPKKPPAVGVPEIGDSSQPEPASALTVETANPADVKAVAELAAGVTGNGYIEQEIVRRTQAAQPTGIRCGFNQFSCYTRLEPGQHVVLRARPLANYVFRAWTGACAGQGPRCVVVAQALRTVTALFTPRSAVASVGFDVNQISVRVKWLRSVGSGQIIVSGRVGGPAALRVQVRRPGGGPLLTRRLAVAGGSFRHVIPLRKDVLPRGARILPGGFVVSVVGRSGASSLPFQLRPIVVPAPVEGVLRQGFVTAIEDGPATVRLPRGTTEAWAHFRLATQPASRLPVKVVWYWPDGRPLGTVSKANRPEIQSFLRLDSGLPNGAWIAELRAGNRIVNRLTVRIG